MKLEERDNDLRAKAEKIVNFSPQEISIITPDEIQRILYDLQVYQIELQMQNDELQKAQLEISQTNNRLNFIYHHIPVGIVTLDFQGFIQQANHTFAQMFGISSNALVKKHFSKLIVDEDKTIFIQRYEPFFKVPTNKSIQLRLYGENNKIFSALLKGSADDGSDAMYGNIDIKQRKLVVAVTDISDAIQS
jgi:PAS domain-containing protein